MKYPLRASTFALAAVLALVGCSGGAVTPSSPAAEAPTPSPTASASASPSASPSAEPVREPTPAFGGECENVLPRVDAEAVLQSPVFVEESSFAYGFSSLGGLRWDWTAERAHASIQVLALPENVVPSDIADRLAEPVCESFLPGQSGCRTAVSEGATWVLVSVPSGQEDVEGDDGFMTQQDEPQERTLERLDRAAAAVGERAGSAAEAVSITRSDAWWSVTSCADLESALPVGEIVGSESPEQVEPFGEDDRVVSAIEAENGVQVACAWAHPDDPESRQVQIVVSPGMAWNWEQIVAGSPEESRSDVELSGVDEAFVGQGSLSSDGPWAWAQDGTNVVQVVDAPNVERATELIVEGLSR